jgi:hypothetical protein
MAHNNRYHSVRDYRAITGQIGDVPADLYESVLLSWARRFAASPKLMA